MSETNPPPADPASSEQLAAQAAIAAQQAAGEKRAKDAKAEADKKAKEDAEALAVKGSEPLKIERTLLVTIHGVMEHPFTLEKFDVGTPRKADIDSWVLLQIAEGKMKRYKAE